MTLAPGARLGPYVVEAAIGAGGMGEVYRARDTRLGRDVAIKVLPAGSAEDPDRLHRFEAEARAAGQLNHPNILAIYDIGTHEQSPYIVSELLEGETLRDRLQGGSLGIRKAIDFAIQIARGLAVAHGKAIVHRDLKPENLFITREERIKILDFGLAKLTDQTPTAGTLTSVPTVLPTEPGTVMGTAGYMSPEQVRAQPLDQRSDIFNLGAVLYEMVSGHRAFPGDSIGEAMSAILKEEPPTLSQTERNVPPGLEFILRYCLEKTPEARWQTAHDLAFALEALSVTSSLPAAVAATSAEPSRSGAVLRNARARYVFAGVGLAVLAAVAGAFQFGKHTAQQAPLAFQRLTFRPGTIWSARFAPEGQTIIYSAAWDGKPVQVFSTRPDSPESRALDIAGADVLSISSAGEMALLLKPGSVMEWGWKWGTLAHVALAGGAPREALKAVQLADWDPAGATLAVVRAVGTRSRLEFPIGNVLYETSDRIGAMRVSRRGDTIAFAERPPGLGANWSIAIVDLTRGKKVLSNGWAGDFIDLAWSPGGDEIWFDTRQGGDNSLHAVSLSGSLRLLASTAVPLQLLDVARDGRVLAARASWRSGILGSPPGTTKEQDLSWLDASEVDDVSFDGKRLLITEFGEGGGAGRWSVYLRTQDEMAAVRLGDGQAFAFSPDGTRALAIRRTSPPQLVLWPIGAGEAITLKGGGITDYTWADWLPDGKRVFFSGTEPGRSTRCYVQDIDGGTPRPVTPDGTSLFVGQKAISPDGNWAAVAGLDGRVALYPISGGPPRPIPGIEPGDVPVRWSADERSLYVFRKIEATPTVHLIDLATGRNERWRELMPPDAAGIVNVWGVHIGPDERSYYYSFTRTMSDLYLVEGLR